MTGREVEVASSDEPVVVDDGIVPVESLPPGDDQPAVEREPATEVVDLDGPTGVTETEAEARLF